jgi:hypothetical protein
LIVDKACDPVAEMGIGLDGIEKPPADFAGADDQNMAEVAAFFLQPDEQ